MQLRFKKRERERDRIGLKFKRKIFIRLAASLGYFGKEKKKHVHFGCQSYYLFLAIKQDSKI